VEAWKTFGPSRGGSRAIFTWLPVVSGVGHEIDLRLATSWQIQGGYAQCCGDHHGRSFLSCQFISKQAAV
jgi:hypothetical protein